MGCSLDFQCAACGSPAVSLPTPLTELAVVRCASCRSEIGTWLDYKGRICSALSRSAATISADPIFVERTPLEARLDECQRTASDKVAAGFGAHH
ncbi:hypothetical protein FHT98_0605 [Bosea sp. AK1]|nr:hypothetical protein FHT98_0605 [Bosea sp. AK1]